MKFLETLIATLLKNWIAVLVVLALVAMALLSISFTIPNRDNIPVPTQS